MEPLTVVEEHGIRFRYVPAGPFLMGSEHGDPDERPVHEVTLDAYWLSETPVSWSTYCDLMGWHTPPRGVPRHDFDGFLLWEQNKIRRRYCLDEKQADTDLFGTASLEQVVEWEAELARHGVVLPADARRPLRYDTKPMVSVGWQDAEELCARLSTADVRYSLPTEAEWEKAARGGLTGKRYPWGDEPPTPGRCDFDHLGSARIAPSRDLPPNGYGLYGMSGGVWEWTADWYDSRSYVEGSGGGGEERVLRGGSWADCAEAVTVSFRMSRRSAPWNADWWGGNVAPNIGFRLCRKDVSGGDP
ncbi:formylglycine-generating enzyme family protein [Virgisporangium ochraceum]|uniref:Sulfatase-modifying factor enzyme-like domain-containing protein n=1 Tax=Virgisporangium ochraceum TaxID=65505 RepID=A0A8J3ZNA7_9ACTN|nr:SUMF1/EgtB/PvdO family nonheme iron enzyme [Virgisporangium ochraceum]GIJ66959.1 hypothetical protein Voc01_018760 [Virgisporangium ochraceum]